MTAYDVEALARYGPRYDIRLGEPAGWIRADRLLDPGGPELTGLLKHESDGRGHTSEHATALSYLAVYAGRVTAFAVLAWALDGVVLDVRPSNLWLKPATPHGIEAVALRSPAILPGGLQALYDVVLARHLIPLTEELHDRTRAGLRQLRGGVAAGSALAFCLPTQVDDPADPAYMLDRWRTFARDAPGGLVDLGDVATVRRGGRDVLVYLRRTCCLYYSCAAAGGTRCASCCLTPLSDRLASYAQK